MLANSYGIHLPSYLTALEAYQHIGIREPVSSLLVGALTPETVVEYAVTTRHVFPGLTLHVLDVAGVTTRTACEATDSVFSEGTALNMPYPPHSMDLIQADYLLDQLEDSGFTDLSYQAKKNRFFQQAHTTLQRGGLLLLVEPVIPWEAVNDLVLDDTGRPDLTEVARLATDHRNTLQHDLQQAGFAQGAIIPGALGFQSRRDLERLLLANEWNVSLDAQVPNASSMLIVAVA